MGKREGMREELARAVLKYAQLRGHEHLELRRDGPHTIFFCNLCNTRCYSDPALEDHLNGNRHVSRSALLRGSAGLRETNAVAQEDSTVSTSDDEAGDEFSASDKFPESEASLREESELALGGTTSTSAAAHVVSSTTTLKWIGSGQLFLKTLSSGSTSLVEASWFCWQGMYKRVELNWQEGNAGRMEYAVVVFPYSDKIGRGGDWPSLKPADEKGTLPVEDMAQNYSLKGGPVASRLKSTISREIVVSSESPLSAQPDTAPSPLTLTIRTKPAETLSGVALQMDGKAAKQGVIKDEVMKTIRKGWKKKLSNKSLDRICFICHQKLLPGKDVAALVNIKSGQMVCGSRNMRGVFHVFHSFCLIEWIAFCEAKSWNESCTMNGNKKPRLSKQAGAGKAVARQSNGGSKSEIAYDGGIFCPECQGTGVKVKGAQLEHPRFRLSQVFDWLLELIEARKAWIEHPVQQVNALGLLFVTPEQSKSMGVVQSQGLIHCYSAGSSRDLGAKAINRDAYSSK